MGAEIVEVVAAAAAAEAEVALEAVVIAVGAFFVDTASMGEENFAVELLTDTRGCEGDDDCDDDDGASSSKMAMGVGRLSRFDLR